jgi:aminoglycoside 3-N-acetyltransferase
LKLFLKKLLPADLRSQIKKLNKKLNRTFLKRGIKKTNNDDIKRLLLNDLGLEKGDNLLITSSFGSLNTEMSPTDLILLLQEIVGLNGNLLMPFYPPGNSYEWAESGQIFDMKNTRSATGILTQIFSEMPCVYKSKHPTKSVVVWGKDAQEIIAGHENSKTPFYWDSPYGWLLKNNSKSVGLGVLNRPVIHACEDVSLGIEKYYQNKFELLIRNYDNSIEGIQVYIHNPKKMRSVSKLLAFNREIGFNYKIVNFCFGVSYVFENQKLLARFKAKFGKN